MPEAEVAVARTPTPLPIPPEYLTRPETAAFLRLKGVRQLDRLIRAAVKAGHPLPPKIKVNRKLTLFPRAGLIAWLNEHRVTGTPLPAPKRRRGRPRKPVASDTSHTKSRRSRKEGAR